MDGLLDYTQSLWYFMLLYLAQKLLVLCVDIICVVHLKCFFGWRDNGDYGHVEEFGFDVQEEGDMVRFYKPVQF